MGSFGKGFSLLLLVILAVSSLMVIESAFAQTIAEIPKPSVPQFALSFLNFSYTQGVNYIQNDSIVVSISNQLFTPYYIDVHLVDLFYKIRWKTQLTDDNWSDGDRIWVVASNCQRGQSNPNATVTTVGIGFSVNNYTDNSGSNDPLPDVPIGGQIDFQVQALIGIFPDAIFYGNSSDWSNTQTITIPSGSNSSPSPTSSSNPTITPTSTPTTTNSIGNPISVPLSTLFVVVSVFLAIIVALSLLLFRRHRKPISQNQPNV